MNGGPSIAALLFGALPVFARCYGFLLPFTAGRLPLRTHETFLVAAALTCGFAVSRGIAPVDGFSVALGLCVVLELIGGILSGVVFALALELPSIAARLLDTNRGALIAEQLLPGQEQRASALETLTAIAAPALVLGLGLHRPIVSALYESLGSGAALGSGSASAFASLAQSILCEAVLLVAPVLLVLFVFDLIGAGASRAYPRLCLVSELSAIRLPLGLGLAGLLLLELHPVLPGVRAGLGEALAAVGFRR